LFLSPGTANIQTTLPAKENYLSMPWFVFLINFVRGPYQDELNKFLKFICRLYVAERVVSKAAFIKTIPY